MNKPNVLLNVLEKVGEEAKEFGKIAVEQVGVAKKGETQTAQASSQTNNQSNEEFIKDLYGDVPAQSPQEIEQQALEDKKNSDALAQKLHAEYFQNLINPPKAPQPRAAEKVEQEVEQERWKLEQKEAKKPKLSRAALQESGTAEMPKVVSG